MSALPPQIWTPNPISEEQELAVIQDRIVSFAIKFGEASQRHGDTTRRESERARDKPWIIPH